MRCGGRSGILWPSQGAAEKKSSGSCRADGDTGLCLSIFAGKPHGAETGGGGRGSSRVQSASHAGPPHTCHFKCREKGFKFFQAAADVTEEVQPTRLTCARRVRLQCGGRLSIRRPFEGSYGQLLGWNKSCAECGNVSPSNKRGPDRSWQMQTVRGKMERTAGGNARRRTMRSFELVRHNNDLRFEGVLLRQAYHAEKSGDWANNIREFLGNGSARCIARNV